MTRGQAKKSKGKDGSLFLLMGLALVAVLAAFGALVLADFDTGKTVLAGVAVLWSALKVVGASAELLDGAPKWLKPILVWSDLLAALVAFAASCVVLLYLLYGISSPT